MRGTGCVILLCRRMGMKRGDCLFLLPQRALYQGSKICRVVARLWNAPFACQDHFCPIAMPKSKAKSIYKKYPHVAKPQENVIG